MHEFVVKQTTQKLKNIPVSDLVKLKENLFWEIGYIKRMKIELL